MNAQVHVGCSGFYYSSWRNNFYPGDVPSREWLRYYSMIFDTVEINSTFYRMPRLTTLERYASETPEDFTFAVKMSRYITHILRLKDARETVTAFQTLVRSGLGSKLACFLFQLPPSFHFTPENLERVLGSVPPGCHNVVEFRHPSWWNEKIQTVFSDAGLTFCNVDYPGLQTPFVTTSPEFYLRLHGKPLLFKSPYSSTQLSEFISHFPRGAKEYRVYFNNTWFDAGYTNAAAMMELIADQV